MMKRKFRWVGLISIVFVQLAVAAPLFAEGGGASEILSLIPVQSGGRIKPFETFAKEMAMAVTGKAKFEGIESVELVWRWMAEPEKWNTTSLISAAHPAVKEIFPEAMIIKNRISPELVLGHEPFIAKVREIARKRELKERLSTEETKLMELYDKAALFREVGRGVYPGWIAHPESPSAGWLSFQTLIGPQGQEILSSFFSQEQAEKMTNVVRDLFLSLREDYQSQESIAAAELFRAELARLFESRGIALDQKKLDMEISYNRLKPFRWAALAYFLSALLFILGMAGSGFHKNKNTAGFVSSVFAAAAVVFTVGFLLHSYGFYLRCVIAGRPPVSNMYESVIWVSWGIALFALILSFFYRSAGLMTSAAVAGALSLVIAQSFPALLDPFITPLVPVLRSNLWLTVHVLTITLSYGAFALAWAIGHAAIFGFTFRPLNKETNHLLSLYLYRAIQIGVVLLAAGTVLGGVWANYSWGRFWGWDPKETWALIALLGYIAVLHGRFSGWMGHFGFAVGSVTAFLGILMAWYGVNYVLAAGLHSYGFGAGGSSYVAAVVGLDAAWILWQVLLYQKRKNLQNA